MLNQLTQYESTQNVFLCAFALAIVVFLVLRFWKQDDIRQKAFDKEVRTEKNALTVIDDGRS